ncbi:MAG: phage head-tail connector protein [Cognatishimia sp.]|nr:phage head-tail connector protein [Cognatishimia sp.]
MNPTLVQAPSEGPVSLEKLKTHLRVSHSEQDDLLRDCLASAVALLDGPYGELGCAMIAQNWREDFPSPPRSGGALELSAGPVTELVSVEYYSAGGDWQAADLANFVLFQDGNSDFLKGAVWPVVGSHVMPLRITYRCGLAATASNLPQNLARAVLMLAGYFFRFSEHAVQGVAPVEVPISVDRLIAPFKRVWV